MSEAILRLGPSRARRCALVVLTVALVAVPGRVPAGSAQINASAPAAQVAQNAALEAHLAAGRKPFLAGDYAAALVAFTNGLAAAQKAGSVRYESTFLALIGVIQEHLGRYAEALKSEQQALVFERQMGASGGEAAVLRSLGSIDQDLGRYADALKANQQALALDLQLGRRTDVATDVGGIGIAQQQLGRYADALKSYQQVFELAQQLGERDLEVTALSNIGLVQEHLGNYPDALKLEQQALALAQQTGNRSAEAEVRRDIGVVDDQLGHYDDAMKSYQQALALDQQLGDRDAVAEVVANIAIVEETQGRYAEALAAHQQALQVYQQLGDRDNEAHELGNIGNVEDDLGRFADALTSHQQALAIDRELGDRAGQMGDLTNIGAVERGLGRFADALATGQSALALAEQLGERDDEAAQLNNIGIVEDSLGRYGDALASLQQALTLDQQLHDRAGQAQALANIGVVERALGRDDEALKAQLQALAVARQLGAKGDEAKTLANIGNLEGDLGRNSDALATHEQALALDQQLGDRDAQAAELGNIGNVEEELGNRAGALTSFQGALALSREVGDRSDEAADLSNIGNLQRELGSFGDALASAREAAELDAQLGEPQWQPLAIAAASEQELGHVADSLADYERAVADVDRLRAGLGDKNQRTSFLRTKQFLYDLYVKYLMDLNRRFPDKGYDRKALEIFERQQARTFLEQVAQSATRAFAGVPSEVSSEEQTLSAGAAQLQSAIAQARSVAEPQGARITALETEAANIASQQSALESKIQASYPAYYALLHPVPLAAESQNPAQPSIAAFQQTVLHADEALLVYDVLDDGTALWVVTPKALRALILPGGASAIQGKLAAFDAYKEQIHHLNTPNSTLPYLGSYSQEHLAPVTTASNDLYDFLIPPDIRPLIAGASTVFIVPSGPLYDFPFEALVTQKPVVLTARPHYLIEDKAISYLSSASLLAVLRAGVERQVPAPNALLAFANPVYAKAAAASNAPAGAGSALAEQRQDAITAALGGQSRAYLPDTGFVPLPGTDQEAHAVFAALGLAPTNATLYEGEDASVTTIDRLNKAGTLKDYRYVFFGAHAVLPDQVKGLTQSSLVLSHPPAGFLTMGDVFGLSLDARAIVLSACESGGGTVTSGEGVQGLTKAFMYAGTPVVSVTDWEVIDQLQSDFNKDFFTALAGGKSAAGALRQAKLAMLNTDDQDDVSRTQPYFWAPTVIFGDGDAP